MSIGNSHDFISFAGVYADRVINEFRFWLSGVNGVNILTSTNGIDFTAVAGAPTRFARGGSFVTTPQSPEQFSFAPVTASFVRFNVLSNQGAGIALAEVQFDSASATDPATSVPEPVTIFGTLMGLGSSAALKRRLKGVKSKSV